MTQENRSGELTEQEVKRILTLIDKMQEVGFGYLKLEQGDLKITLSKGNLESAPAAPAVQTGVAATATTAAPSVAASASVSVAPTRTDAPPTSEAEAAAAVALATQGTGSEKLTASTAYDGHVVTSPIVGCFYRAPEPGAPPFTEVGLEVTEETTLCIVEVMKVFSAISAGVRGVVTEILVADGDFIEYDQPLFVIKQDVAGSRS